MYVFGDKIMPFILFQQKFYHIKLAVKLLVLINSDILKLFKRIFLVSTYHVWFLEQRTISMTTKEDRNIY